MRWQDTLQQQRRRGLLWTPLALSLGIGGYFALLSEPTKLQLGLLMVFIVAVLIATRKLPFAFGFLLSGLALMAFGLILATTRANLVAEPVLGFHYYGAVSGRIVAIDRSASDRVRITLDSVLLERTSTARTPKRVRISLHYATPSTVPEPGQRVIITASLSPPAGPVEPLGFNFQRFAWFKQLGAVGYARTPLLEIGPPEVTGLAVRLFQWRMRISQQIQQRIPGQPGAFAAAILTGDRASIDPEMLANLRRSNLAHLLAISGLHMGLLTGFVFASVRYAIALWPAVALRVPSKKIGAVVAFAMAVAYLALSGANIATQRAFIMVAVMLLAVMLDRRAITLRAVALAATIVLTLRPESLTEAGFQMSFSATTALVAVFAWLRDRDISFHNRGPVRWWLMPLATMAMASAIAGLATAPISAAHFNMVAQYGLLANIASVPVMGIVVMPAAVVAALLSLIGLEGPAFWVMGQGIEWILNVATYVASLDHAVTRVVKPQPIVLPTIAVGGYLLVLLKGRLRSIGIVPILVALILWAQTDRAVLLVSPNGRLLGLMTTEGRALNHAKGNGFAASNWLENDGDGATQEDAAARDFALQELDIGYLWGKKRTDDEIVAACGQYKLVIIPQWKGSVSGCRIIGAGEFAKLGAIAISADLNVTGARPMEGKRLWSR